MVKIKRYIIRLSKQQVDTLNNNIKYKNCRDKCFSVLSYIVKHATINKGSFMKSFAEFHKMYIRYHQKYNMCLANFKKIIKKLEDLGLVFINIYKNTNIYCVDQKVAKKVAKNICVLSKADTKVEGKNRNTEILTSLDYTNTIKTEDLLAYYAKSYKGLSGNPVLKKSELKKIAKNLFSLRGVHEAMIQNMVFAKIINSNVKIQAAGAIQYIDAIITDKLIMTTRFRKCY